MISSFPMFNGASLLGINSGYSNAYTGMQVANIFAGVLGQVTNAYQAEKAADKQADLDMDAALRNIDKEIKEVEDSNPEDKISKSYEKNIIKATRRRDTVSGEITKANDALAAIEKEPDSEIKTSRKQNAEKKLKELEAEYNKLTNTDANTEGSIEYCKKKRDDELKRLKQAKKDKLTELKERKAKLENQINNRDLDKLSKKVKKGSDDVLTGKLQNNGKLKEGQSFDVTDFNTAVHRLMNSTRGSEERYKNAQLVSYIYKNLPETDKNSRLKNSAEIAEEEIRKYDKEHNDNNTLKA